MASETPERARRPALPRRLLRTEWKIWRSLALWTTRRRPGVTATTVAFPYSRDVTPLLLAFLFGSLLELPVFHFLLPWEPARLGALVLGVWGLLWMVGYIAAMRVFPHLLDERGLRIRHGASVDLLVPWDAIADVRAERDRVPRNDPLQFAIGPDGTAAKVAILKQTRVTVELREPLVLPYRDDPREVVMVKLAADDPAGLVEAARRQLAALNPT
ncbi:hypothetical protein [Conexibacter woesei]|uniref:PH domain-containing protein n=1 Tax=Conexibacter woesei (strain DSM 14684 / CCUG 47730 / CIP 108061 / JCM 11494 / NBRC 100937 / ID131577) TaxID=469383 RepID=D3FDG3_CONWI|nr:hypothetical protein [Conexibacter woesei]ADB53555.1 hypothetical protein Cwoe_5146 [Conexibacter woesei DSM 14684]